MTYDGTINLIEAGSTVSPAGTGALSFASGTTGSGSLALQTPGELGNPGNSGIAVVAGETACTTACQQVGVGVQPTSAQFYVTYGSQLQQGPSGGSYPVYLQGTEKVGTTTEPLFDYQLSAGVDGNGRELIGSKYVEYVVDATHAFLLSLNPHSTADLLSGSVTLVPPVQ